MNTARAAATTILTEQEISAVRHQHREYLFDDVITGAYDVRVVHVGEPKAAQILNTACWYHAEDTHHILLGERIPANLVRDRVGDAACRDRYATAFYQHEAMHSLYTDRNLSGVSASCAAEGIPFKLLNLAEDARIEHLGRTHHAIVFGWKDAEPPPTSAEPAGVLFTIIQHEAQASWRDVARANGASDQRMDQVQGFYARFCAATCTRALIPLLKDWQAAFPSTADDSQGAGGAGGGAGDPGDGQGASGGQSQQGGTPGPGGSGTAQPGQSANQVPGIPDGDWRSEDMANALALEQDDQAAAQILASASQASQPSNAAGDQAANTGDVDEPTAGPSAAVGAVPTIAASSNGDLLAPERMAHLDRGYVSEMARRLEAMLTSGPTELIRTEIPSRTLDRRRLLLDRQDVYIHEVDGVERGPIPTVLMVDCSGSMDGLPIAGGRMLVAAINELAKRDLVDARLILTGNNGENIHHTMRLPMRLEDIERITAVGGHEAFGSTMEATRDVVQHANNGIFLVYTDGQIANTPRDVGAWRREGILPVGCYVGDTDKTASLRNWFDYSISSQDVGGLIDRIVDEIKDLRK